MTNPFSWLPPDLQGSVMTGIAVASLAMAKILSTVGAGLTLKDDGVPFGIMNLEVSWSTERAKAIVALWRKNGVVCKAVQQTRLDFVFLLIYPTALSLACVMTAGGVEGFMASAGVALSWIVLLAAPFDTIENIMLLKMLEGTFEPNMARFTSISASIKFLIILATLLYLILMVFMK